MKCPGQDMQFWKPGAIFDTPCTKCGKPVEFFKDESTRKCKHCGTTVMNPRMDFGCASYCQFAEQCLGTLSPELLAQRKDLLKDRVAVNWTWINFNPGLGLVGVESFVTTKQK